MKRRYVVLAAVAVAVVGLVVALSDYVRLLRPSVLKQLAPGVVALVNELPGVDKQNEDILGRLFAPAGLAHAKDAADGVMRIDVRAPRREPIWNPGIVFMPGS